jgi:hypothetical protein
MLFITNLQQTFIGAASAVLDSILRFLPNLIVSLVVFWLGTIIAKWLAKLTQGLLGRLKIDHFSKKFGLKDFLKKARVEISLEELLSQFVRWVIIFIFFITAVNILGLSAVSDVLARVLSYLPKVISATLILAVGFLLVGLVESVVLAGLSQLGDKVAEIGSKAAYYLLLFVVILAAINELGIAQSLTNILFTGLVGSLALGFGLSLGLGAKDLVAQLLEDWYKKLKK